MQTREFSSWNQLEDGVVLNEVQGMEVGKPIPLSKTEQKIFNEVVNLISEIE